MSKEEVEEVGYGRKESRKEEYTSQRRQEGRKGKEGGIKRVSQRRSPFANL